MPAGMPQGMGRRTIRYFGWTFGFESVKNQSLADTYN